ncbi:MAG TPA: glutamine--tRNA ligase/YqeY domain fusion protein [Longimicrobiales bacterium]|nr:glutamine--tRNA ligase/YqeY domain fusion protein [Longimicrobiales bacterium]
MSEAKPTRPAGTDFIRQIVAAHLAEGRYASPVTRFPPEPNGYLHLGHVKSNCLNFGIAQEFGGRCHLRFDDTNPETEDLEYVGAIQDDVRWLGFDWGEHLYFASDYFERMYECAEILVGKGLAYVDDASEEEISESRGTVTRPGTPTPCRSRSVEENLDLFRRMRAGEFPDGSKVLRAKADLESPNMIMRDPVLYRIRHAHHYRRGDTWCIYPLYDYAHCLEDAFEGVTHSICTLEFENNREIYDWLLDNVGFAEPRTHQYEFARLELEYTVLSKRKFIRLVKEGHVGGWDDPRMPTVAGLRRRGVPPEALRYFADIIGVAKANSRVDIGKLDHAIRETLNPVAPRVMAVLEPLKVVLTSWPAGTVEELDAPYFPHDVPREGSRRVPFAQELWIERSDFSEDPPRGFRRLVPGGEVRLRYAYVIRCDDVVKDAAGNVVELRCSHDPDTRSGGADGRKGIGTIHWVSARHALDAEVRLYDRLFGVPDPDDVPEGGDFTDHLNPDSLRVLQGAKVEPSVAGDHPATRYQFERTGYVWRDPVDGVGDHLVFNRIITLKDTWVRQAAGREERASGGAGKAPSGRAPVSVAAPRGAPAADKPRVSEERAGRRRADPELARRMERYTRELGLSAEDADLLTGSRDLSDFFDEALAAHEDAAAVAGWVVNDLPAVLGGRTLDALPFDGRGLGVLVRLVGEGRISRRAAKDVLAHMAEKGGEPEEIMRRLGLETMDDHGAVEAVVDAALARWPEKVAEYRAGRANLMGLFVGEVMKATKGAADPKAVKDLLTRKLGA